MTALHRASSSGYTDVVKLLVDSGAQLDIKDIDGWTALDLASNNGHTDVVKVLRASGAHHGKRYLGQRLLKRCKAGCTAKVGKFKSLLDQGVDPNIQDEDGRHPLWYASRYGKRDLVELFLEYKADINLKTKDGLTALHLASSNCHTGVVKLLVDSGAQLDNKDKSQRLLKLCKAGCTAKVGVFKSLLDQGVDPNIRYKVFSGFVMICIWILCFRGGECALELTSTLPASNRTCPGARIVFNCSIAGSVANVIISVGSSEYIGQGTFLEFDTDFTVGDLKTSEINENVTAQLVYKGNDGGNSTLISQLHLRTSTTILNSTVTCHSSIDESMKSITFFILSIPGRPQNVEGTEVLRVDDMCVIFLTWDAPLDYDEEDIDHYIVQSPSPNNIIETNAKAISVSISIPRYIPDIHINVSSVDRCGREGPSTDIIVLHLDLTTVNETPPSQQVTTQQENQSGSLKEAVIALGFIAGVLLVLLVLFILFVLYLLSKKKL